MPAIHAQPLRVVLVGACTPAGRELLTVLRAASVWVTALVNAPVELPTDEVIGNWMHNPIAVDAMSEADAVILLADNEAASPLAQACRVAEAVGEWPVRVVCFSSPAGDMQGRLVEEVLGGMANSVVLRVGAASVAEWAEIAYAAAQGVGRAGVYALAKISPLAPSGGELDLAEA